MGNSFNHAFAVGEVVTAGTLNSLVPSISLGSTTNIMNTLYQNTLGSIRMVNVVANPSTSVALIYTAYCASTSSPSTRVVAIAHTNTAEFRMLTFVVPPQFYYTVSTSFTGGVTQNWVEWNIFVT